MLGKKIYDALFSGVNEYGKIAIQHFSESATVAQSQRALLAFVNGSAQLGADELEILFVDAIRKEGPVFPNVPATKRARQQGAALVASDGDALPDPQAAAAGFGNGAGGARAFLSALASAAAGAFGIGD